MRTFALVILDISEQITDRIEMPIVTNLQGLGYSLNIAKIETEIEDYVTKVVQLKKVISLTQIHKTGYKGMNAFNAWVLKNVDNTICLEYNDGESVRYCEVKIIDSSYTEKSVYNVLEQVVQIQPLTPLFTRVENSIRIQVSKTGKKYPLLYPYSYGTSRIENNEIKNIYFKDVPITVTLYGPLENPHISLLDESGTVYNEIVMTVAITTGQKLVINAAQRKIWLVKADGTTEDYYFKVNGAYDSYLRAKGLCTSKIDINIGVQDGYLIGVWRQYRL